jgi:mannose-6-phosphate isomerase-like protein (cupin superfamily)
MQFKNEFINKYIKDHNLNIISSNEEKPWGGYYVYEETPEYDKKILWVKPGNYLSLQFHGTPTHLGHSEIATALNNFKIVIGTKNVVGLNEEEMQVELRNLKVISLSSGESIDIPAGFLHAYVNPFKEDMYLLETRTSQIPETSADRESNIVRIYDQTRRDNLPDWPEEMQAKIMQ